MTDWNNLLNSVNQKVIGIINSTKDSFTGDGVFENKERLGFLLKTAEEKEIKILDVGGVSTKPGFKEVSYEQELKRLNFFISNYFGKFKLSVDTMNYDIAKHALENNDLLEVADALTDILYVTYGAGHAFGINLDACFEEVQNSNMSKLGNDGKPIYNDQGKVMKGPNYYKPDLSKYIK